MSLLINFYNQIGAGPKNISLNFIQNLIEKNSDQVVFVIIPNVEEYIKLESKGNIKFIKFKRYTNILSKIMFRIYLDLIFIPYIISKYKIKSLLAFGNYLISPVNIKKIVLLHHPYLVDNTLLNGLSIIPKLVERLKRFVFWITLKNIDVVVVQSDYMKESLLKVWKIDSKNISINPNPISKNFTKKYSELEINELINKRQNTIQDKIIILYISRFYPHKNHNFLIELSDTLNKNNIQHEILVTVDFNNPETLNFQKELQNKRTSIYNIGEINQSKLEIYYKKSHVFIFPSNSETFGNPLIEAMKFALPIIVPDLSYAHSVVGESGLYYPQNNVIECLKLVDKLKSNKDIYLSKSLESNEKFDNYPEVGCWVDQYFSLAGIK